MATLDRPRARLRKMVTGRGQRWLLVGGVGVVLVGLLIYAGVAHFAASAPRPLSALDEGVALNGVPAPAFSLKDQNGVPVSLDQFRGHPVVLTFFDSVCPHPDCSLMAQYINWTAKDMGAESSRVAWVALTVNPWHDTPETATAFLSTRQVTIPLRYLLGGVETMKPLWKAYHMLVVPPDANGIVTHGTGVYVIDPNGREQLWLDEGFDPAALSAYLHDMLKGGGSPVKNGGSPPTRGVTTAAKQVNGQNVLFTAQPGQFGSYDYSITLEDAQRQPIQGASVEMDLGMTNMPMTPLHLPLDPSQQRIPGTYQAKGVVAMVGPWRATVHVTLPGSAPFTTTFDYTVQY